MRLYEMLERVSEVVYQDNPSPLLTYLKNTLDDDGCFLRSRYGRRHEGEVADRELGEVGFIMVASNMPFSPKHVQFKSTIHLPSFQHPSHHLLYFTSYKRNSPAFAGLFRQADPRHVNDGGSTNKTQ